MKHIFSFIQTSSKCLREGPLHCEIGNMRPKQTGVYNSILLGRDKEQRSSNRSNNQVADQHY